MNVPWDQDGLCNLARSSAVIATAKPHLKLMPSQTQTRNSQSHDTNCPFHE